MDVIFMSSVCNVYIWTRLKLFQDVHTKWNNVRKHYCFKWPMSLVMSLLVAHVIYQAQTPCLIPILLIGKGVWCVWLICRHFADFCMTKMLNTLATTSAGINSDEDFQKCHWCRENNLQISAKFLDSRFQENMQEVHAEKKTGQSDARLEMSPWNFSAHLAVQIGVCIITIQYNKTDVLASV